jgi:Permuted papain-like amidase enzyme, YaeF/YiiX, C92 family
MTMFDNLLDRIGRRLATHLETEVSGYQPFTPSDPETLSATLQPCDVLLIEGNQHLSSAIKFLTQSTWSHAALYVGDALGTPPDGAEPRRLIEADLGIGIHAVPLSRYRTFNTRICRPVGLTEEDQRKVIDFAIARLGYKYDLRNIIDLARYLLPNPPVPMRWRRRMLALGSGDPTRAICSTLIAEAFETVRYPVLPRVEKFEIKRRGVSDFARWEILHIRHYSLFAPRDFDISPYFRVVKPTIEKGFDYKALNWSTDAPDEGPIGRGRPVEDRTTKAKSLDKLEP